MPKIVDHDERRRVIVDAVTQIIMREGFDHVTMRNVAQELGFSHGALTRYFPDRKSLLIAVFVHVVDDWEARFATIVEGVRGLEALRRLGKEVLPFGELGMLRTRLILTFWSRATVDQEVLEIFRENYLVRRAHIRRFLLEAIEDGEVSEHLDVETEVNRISVSNAGWQMLAALMPEEATAEHLNLSLDATSEYLRSERAATK